MGTWASCASIGSARVHVGATKISTGLSSALTVASRIGRRQNEEAQELLQRAIAIEPDYARAHAVLAWAVWWATLLVALRLDTRIAAIARDRSEYQAATGDADHTQGSKKVFDFIEAAGIKWYAAGEIIAQNRYYPSLLDSAKTAVSGWLGSSSHRPRGP